MKIWSIGHMSLEEQGKDVEKNKMFKKPNQIKFELSKEKERKKKHVEK